MWRKRVEGIGRNKNALLIYFPMNRSKLDLTLGLSRTELSQNLHLMFLRGFYLLAHSFREHRISFVGSWDPISSSLSEVIMAQILYANPSAFSSATSPKKTEKMSVRRKLGSLRRTNMLAKKGVSSSQTSLEKFEKNPSSAEEFEEFSQTWSEDEGHLFNVEKVKIPKEGKEAVEEKTTSILSEKSRRGSGSLIFRKLASVDLTPAQVSVVCMRFFVQNSNHELWVSFQDGSVCVYCPSTLQVKNVVLCGKETSQKTKKGRGPVEEKKPHIWSPLTPGRKAVDYRASFEYSSFCRSFFFSSYFFGCLCE